MPQASHRDLMAMAGLDREMAELAALDRRARRGVIESSFLRNRRSSRFSLETLGVKQEEARVVDGVDDRPPRRPKLKR